MATVEYAALAVLVSVVLAAGGTALGAERVPVAVAAQMRRALCLVQGGDCLDRTGPRPCVVATDARSRDTRVSAVVVRLADGRTVLRERRSDGSVRVTVLQSTGAGAGVVLGAQLRVAGRGVHSVVDAAGGVRAAFGRRFVVPDDAAADRLIARLAADDLPAAGAAVGIAGFLLGRDARGAPPDERLVELGARAEAEAVLSLLGLRAHATGLAGVAQGVRVDRRTGERTVVLRLEREAVAALAAPLGQRVGAGRTGETIVEVAFDPRGSPAALVVRHAEAVRGDVRVGPFRQGGGDRLELEARLDLADPEARVLARDLLGRLRSADPAALGAARALGARMADRARLDERLYATTRDERTSGYEVAFLGRLGGTVARVTETGRLVAAAGREPGLGWSRRLDCAGVS